MIAGFEPFEAEGEGVTIHGVRGGEGPPLLLLHGFPQSHLLWERIAPLLKDRFTLVMPDLRGYGASGKPASGPDHAAYSKRAMAADMVRVMAGFGHERFFVAGHDRGGRVTHRMALDHPERIDRAAVLDIAPTLAMYRSTDERFARAYWHWFFLIRPHPLPERSIAAAPDAYLDAFFGGWGTRPKISEAAMAAYRAAFGDEEALRAMCEDYRAGAGIDLEHDTADLDRRIACPLLVLYGGDGVIAQCFDVAALWRDRAGARTVRAMPGGHFFVDDHPGATAEALADFFASA